MKNNLDQSNFNIIIKDLEHFELVSNKALQEPLLQELDEPSMKVVIGGDGNKHSTGGKGNKHSTNGKGNKQFKCKNFEIKKYYASLGYYNILAWGPC